MQTQDEETLYLELYLAIPKCLNNMNEVSRAENFSLTFLQDVTG
jgi:hypothetical protein